MTNPLISVIIPNYCHSKFLDQRIQSVLKQTYKNFEVIILDDASPDNGASRIIIESYRGNPHVSHIVYNDVNSGSTFKQWEKGLRLAKGEYCWIAESDDYCEVTFLEEIIKELSKHKNIVLAFAPTVYINEDGTKKWYYSKEGRNQCVSSRNFITKYLTVNNCIQNASCCVFSRMDALKIDTRYTNYPGLGDWWFWLELAERGKAVIVNKHLCYFRRYAGTVTSKNIANGLNLIHEKELLEYIASRYWIPKWKWNYIYHRHAESKKRLRFNSEEIHRHMSELWQFDKKYSRFELFIYRLLNKLQRDYLVRI